MESSLQEKISSPATTASVKQELEEQLKQEPEEQLKLGKFYFHESGESVLFLPA